MSSKRLSDILANGNRTELSRAWATTQAAEDFGPLSAGEYVAHVISGELFTSRQNATPGYKLCFGVCEGEHTGRRVWHDLWLTPAALPMTKRDLAKLGVTAIEQLDGPLPQGIRCKLKVALRRDNAGAEHNRIRSFDVLGVDEPEADAFAPADEDTDGQCPTEGGETLPEKPDDGIPV